MKRYKVISTGSFWRPWFYRLIIIFIIIIGGIWFLRMFDAIQQVDRQNKNLIQEFGQNKIALMQTVADLNEVRKYLLLPSRKYNFFSSDGIIKNQPEESVALATAIYRFTDTVGKEYLTAKQQDENYQKIVTLKNNHDFKNALSKIDLYADKHLEDTTEYAVLKIYRDKDLFVQIMLDKTDNSFSIRSIIGSALIDINDDQNLYEFIIAYITEHKETIKITQERINIQKKALQKIWEQEEVGNILSTKKLQASLNPIEDESGFMYAVQNVDSEKVLTILLDRQNGNFHLADDIYSDITALQPALIAVLQQLDGTTKRLHDTEKKAAELQTLLEESAFIAALQTHHLSLSAPREDQGRRYFDLMNTDDQNVIGSIVFEISTGNISFMRFGDDAEQTIEEILKNGSKKNF